MLNHPSITTNASAPPHVAETGTRLRAAEDGDAPRILAWRNHPAVRRVMFTDHCIAAAEHEAWWQRVRRSQHHRVLVVVHEGLDCGVVTFTRENDADPTIWTWGFYLDPDAFARPADHLRAWSGMELASLRWAASLPGAARLHCEVYSFNAAVLAMHRRHGFTERGRYLRQRGEQALEVVRLGRAIVQPAG